MNQYQSITKMYFYFIVLAVVACFITMFMKNPLLFYAACAVVVIFIFLWVMSAMSKTAHHSANRMVGYMAEQQEGLIDTIQQQQANMLEMMRLQQEQAQQQQVIAAQLIAQRYQQLPEARTRYPEYYSVIYEGTIVDRPRLANNDGPKKLQQPQAQQKIIKQGYTMTEADMIASLSQRQRRCVEVARSNNIPLQTNNGKSYIVLGNNKTYTLTTEQLAYWYSLQ